MHEEASVGEAVAGQMWAQRRCGNREGRVRDKHSNGGSQDGQVPGMGRLAPGEFFKAVPFLLSVMLLFSVPNLLRPRPSSFARIPHSSCLFLTSLAVSQKEARDTLLRKRSVLCVVFMLLPAPTVEALRSGLTRMVDTESCCCQAVTNNSDSAWFPPCLTPLPDSINTLLYGTSKTSSISFY